MTFKKILSYYIMFVFFCLSYHKRTSDINLYLSHTQLSEVGLNTLESGHLPCQLAITEYQSVPQI